jgi:hypothetical protein
MTYIRSWKSLRLTSHTWLGLNPQIGRPLSRIVVPLVYFFLYLAECQQKIHAKFYVQDINLPQNIIKLLQPNTSDKIKSVRGVLHLLG